MRIEAQGNDELVSLAMDTIQVGKQALIFVNAKRSAEKVAEDIAKKITSPGQGLNEISAQALKSLTRPTRQCERLAKCLQKGVAFHHAGLTQKQKDIVQDEFMAGKIRIIAATPTLAAGVDLPAFRSIIRDAKRYGNRGLSYIPVLEYLQMAGRAGRPSFDSYGEAILVAKSDAEKQELSERYIYGEPESIYSKLAVEPVLRFYLLSLIAGNFVRTKEQIMDFFSRSFWAFQYEDMPMLEVIIDRMIELLGGFGFVELDNGRYTATAAGKRVAELYLDPLTAYNFIKALRNAKMPSAFALLQMISSTNEIKPLLSLKVKDHDIVNNKLAAVETELIAEIPTMFDYEFEDFLKSIKTSMFFDDWINEKDEESLLEKHDIRPGEIRAKLSLADWLVYSASELAKLHAMRDAQKSLNILRVRLKHGAKEDLLLLLRLKNIGRMRARKLFSNGIKDTSALKNADITTLKQLLGPKIAQDVKEQLGTMTFTEH